MSKNREEDQMVSFLHQKALFDKIMPALREIVDNNGGAEAMLKKSESLAAMALIKKASEGDVKAASEILNRTVGKPIERSVSLFADVNRMQDRDIDSQISRLLKQVGGNKLLTTALELPKAKKQKRKPRKSEPQIIDVEATPHGSQEPTA